MPLKPNQIRGHVSLAAYILKWSAIVIPVGLVVGSANALFLYLLELVTEFRLHHVELIFALPFAGVLIVGLYEWWGQSKRNSAIGHSDQGNNLIMNEIHKPGGGVPLRMAPLVLLTTVGTHLFGGSAGREGTAIQIGGSLAELVHIVFRPIFKLSAEDKRTILMAGVAAGFGGVFGVPMAGAIFAIEVLAIGRMSYESFFPCMLASIIADYACRAWGIHHTAYQVASLVGGAEVAVPYFDWLLMLKTVIAAACFGMAGALFAGVTHRLSKLFKLVRWPLVRPMIGGLVLLGFAYVLGTTDYMGLGTHTLDENGVSILSAFHAGGADGWSWLWKLLFTAITLSAGFKGGEVTPLFFIGATLGNTLAWVLGAPVDLFAAMGLIAVFAGATNTPIACTIMGIELFGPTHVAYLALACCVAYYFSGHRGIYTAQRVHTPKPAAAELAKAGH